MSRAIPKLSLHLARTKFAVLVVPLIRGRKRSTRGTAMCYTVSACFHMTCGLPFFKIHPFNSIQLLHHCGFMGTSMRAATYSSLWHLAVLSFHQSPPSRTLKALNSFILSIKLLAFARIHHLGLCVTFSTRAAFNFSHLRF